MKILDMEWKSLHFLSDFIIFIWFEKRGSQRQKKIFSVKSEVCGCSNSQKTYFTSIKWQISFQTFFLKDRFRYFHTAKFKIFHWNRKRKVWKIRHSELENFSCELAKEKLEMAEKIATHYSKKELFVEQRSEVNRGLKSL